MYRGFISLVFVLVLAAGCSKKDQVKRVHSKQTVYEMYLQRGISSLNQFNSTHDSAQLVASEHYLDSASKQKALTKLVVVPKVSIYLYQKQLAKGRKYVESIDAGQFPRSYMKEMYLNFFDALILNRNQEIEKRDDSMKKAVESVENYLKTHSKDKDGISDLFSLKMYSEPGEKLFADMDEYVKKYPESKMIVTDLKKSLKDVLKKSKQ